MQPLKHQVRPGERHRSAGKGQGGGVGTREIGFGRLAEIHQPLEETPFAAGLGQHGRGVVDGDAGRAGIAHRERGQVAAGAAAEIEDALGLDADVIEALANAAGYFPGEGVDAGVICSRSPGSTPHELRVELEIRCGHRGRFRRI